MSELFALRDRHLLSLQLQVLHVALSLDDLSVVMDALLSGRLTEASGHAEKHALEGSFWSHLRIFQVAHLELAGDLAAVEWTADLGVQNRLLLHCRNQSIQHADFRRAGQNRAGDLGHGWLKHFQFFVLNNSQVAVVRLHVVGRWVMFFDLYRRLGVKLDCCFEFRCFRHFILE